MNKFTLFLIACIGIFSSLKAEQNDERNTILYLISSDRDYIGLGKTRIYNQYDGDFRFRLDYPEKLSFQYMNVGMEACWNLDISVPRGTSLNTGIYLQALGFNEKTHPKLSFDGCGRGCSGSIGSFEILEMEFDLNNKIESFAMNFVQHCGSRKSSPLFGCLRYNSKVPLETTVSALYNYRLPPKSLLYYNRTGEYKFANYHKLIDFDGNVFDDNEGEFKPKFLTSCEAKFEYAAYTDLEDGIIIKIEDNEDTNWTLEFSTLQESGFVSGLSESLEPTPPYNKPYSFYCLTPRIQVTVDGETYDYGEFKVHKIVKNEKGEIEELAIDFKASVSSRDDHLDCALRFNSDVPVKLFIPNIE